MAAGSTYTPLATQTLGSAAASVTFSSISGSYTDLVIIANYKTSSSAVDIRYRLNSDTASNYSWTYLAGSGASASSGNAASVGYVQFTNGPTSSSTANATTIFNLQNYSNTTTYKTIMTRVNVAENGVAAHIGLWRSTSAINAFEIYVPTAGQSFSIGSTFTLYGIAAA